MRIGTVTFWDTQDNYGQVLQCYALIHFLKSLGHEAFLIKHSLYKESRKELLTKTIKSLVSPRTIYNKLVNINQILTSKKDTTQHPRYFDDFRKKYIPSTPMIYDYAQLVEKPPVADVYVCGSDQIWRNLNPIYYLQFGSQQTKRIAYAPSTGGKIFGSSDKKVLKKYLSDFDFLSSREVSGTDLLHELGFDKAAVVPDPTMLLKVSDFRELEDKKQKHEKPYLLVYLLGGKTDLKIERIYEFANKLNLQVKYIASQGRNDSFPKIYPTIEEWLELIDHASYFITNSFHGTVFSLFFNTPFMTLPLTGNYSSMNDRIFGLLKKADLMDRVFNGSLDTITDPINFDVFEKKKSEDVERIKDIFASILV